MTIRERFPPVLVVKYYLYMGTVTYGFFWPIFTLFMLARGLSYTQIGLLGSLSAGATILGEIPTGYVGDRFGRRLSLIISGVLLAGSLFGFIIATSFAAFAVLWGVWGFGMAFRSGSIDAWLYDVLEHHLDESVFTRVRGRGSSVNHWVSAGTMLTAGGLYTLDHRLPFLAGGFLLILSIPVVLSFPRVPRDEIEDHLTFLDAMPAVRERLTVPPLRSVVLYIALFFGILSATDEFIQPIATQAVGLPVSSMGPLYAGFSAVSAVVAYFAGDIESWLSTRRALIVIPLLTSFCFFIPVAVPLAALPLFFTMKASRSVVTPIVNGYINNHVESASRATVLSAVSFIYALVRLPLRPLVGALADRSSLLHAIAGVTLVFLAGAILLYLTDGIGEVPAKSEQSAKQVSGSNDDG